MKEAKHPHWFQFKTDIFFEIRDLKAKLQHRVDELDTLLNLLPVGVWIGNHDCSQIVGNPAAYDIFGFPQGINASVTTCSGDRACR